MDYADRLRMMGCEPPEAPSNNDFQALESGVGVPLPASYRTFLAFCGGWSGDLVCPSREPTPSGDLHLINGFYDAGEVAGLLDSMIVPRNMIMIGWVHGTKYTCLSIAGIDRGSVYALDGEFRAYWSDEEFERRYNAMAAEIREYLALRRDDKLPSKPAGYGCAYLLAEDFEEFLSSCRPVKDA